MANSGSKKNRKIREEHQKKKVQNKKSIRGQAETEYGEIKNIVSFSLTQTGINLLKQKSKKLGISASELLERLARGENQIDFPPSE